MTTTANYNLPLYEAGDAVASVSMHNNTVNATDVALKAIDDKASAGAAKKATKIAYAGLLEANQTSATVNAGTLNANSTVEVQSEETGVLPTAITIDADAKTVTVEFPAQSADMWFTVEVRNTLA